MPHVSPRTPHVPTPQTLACPAGTRLGHDSDSDPGWGEVEQTQGCERPGGVLHGPAILGVVSAPGLHQTKLVGRYADGRRVGSWTQFTETGALLGRFTLDDGGSGVEEIRDQVGHVKRGSVVGGRREGPWIYFDRDGRVAMTQSWSGGTLVRSTGSAPWDPCYDCPDPQDKCPDPRDGRDGSRGSSDDDGCP